jgi:hypothetical protein
MKKVKIGDKMNSSELKDFIGIFPNAVSSDYCHKVIKHYDYVASWQKTVSRQDHEKASNIHKKTDQYFFENEQDPTLISTNAIIGKEFVDAFWECYKTYADEYGVLTSISQHRMSDTIKLQKTMPAGGYHVWHCEHDGHQNGRRLMLVMLYLNTVEEGGETEFLYQSKRVQAKQGTLVICPSGFTHTHRGNPPLKSAKYLMNSWVEFV